MLPSSTEAVILHMIIFARILGKVFKYLFQLNSLDFPIGSKTTFLSLPPIPAERIVPTDSPPPPEKKSFTLGLY